jgi:hypothetical protein
VVVNLGSVIEACKLPTGTSAQKAELVTLTWALKLAAGVWQTTLLTLNMPSQPFMSMGPYIKRGDSLTQEEKVSNIVRKSLNC